MCFSAVFAVMNEKKTTIFAIELNLQLCFEIYFIHCNFFFFLAKKKPFVVDDLGTQKRKTGMD